MGSDCSSSWSLQIIYFSNYAAMTRPECRVWLTIYSLCILTICIISYFPFWVLRAAFGFYLFQLLIVACFLIFS